MQSLNETLKKYALKPHRYEKSGKVTFVDTGDGRFVVKNNNKDNQIFAYLESRNFHYFPEILSDGKDKYEISEYVEEFDLPKEQKMMDMVDLVALLHSKTTHYKEVDSADYKKIYEDVNNNIAYLYSYYNDLITLIESKIYMSPSEYLLARNIYKVYAALGFCKQEIDNWYELVKDKKKQRFVVLHNNLDLSHFLRNQNSYLVSWDKAKIDIPVFDIYKLYKRHGLDFEFTEVLKRYEKGYPLLPEERKLFFILVALPDKIDLLDSEYEMTKQIVRIVDFTYKTEMLLSPYYAENKEKNQ